MDTIRCKHCGAVIALVTKGAVERPITLKCNQCQVRRLVRPCEQVDNKQRISYTEVVT